MIRAADGEGPGGAGQGEGARAGSAQGETARGAVLIIDDEESARELFSAWLIEAGFAVRTAAGAGEGLAAAAGRQPDAVVLDLKMPPDPWGGLKVLEDLRQRHPDLPVVIASDKADLRHAVEAIRLGAFDFVDKQEARSKLAIAVGNAVRFLRLQERTEALEAENRLFREEQERRNLSAFGGLTGASPAMQAVYELIQRAAPTDASVLILGETGTGKELAAAAIHYNSLKKDGPFSKVNCASLPETLLEDELFGHEKGAFTGADAKRPGRFELAHGGTLFLDEIGDMSLATQAKVLRAIQEREFERVGGTRTIRVDVRLVAATNQDLAARMNEGRFRADLYYRLNDIVLVLPPLRQRKEDIPLLAEAVMKEFGDAYRGKVLSPEFVEALGAYDWPGNVRELKGVIRKACILATGEVVRVTGLPPEVLAAAGSSQARGGEAGDDLSAVESALVRRALDTMGDDLGEMARDLGVSISSLLEVARRHGFR